MATAKENLTDMITCEVCYNTFCGRDPRILPCGHGFCLVCIHDIHRVAAKNKNTHLKQEEFRCPKCQLVSNMPPNFGYPKYFQAHQMMDILGDLDKNVLKEDKAGNPEVCYLCRKKDTSAYCFTCTKSMCDQCLQAHNRNKRYDGHEKIKVRKDQIETLVCVEHGQMVEAYCTRCWKVVCAQCQLASHVNHNIRDFIIEGSFSGMDLISEIDVKQDTFNKKLVRLDQMEAELNSHIDNLHDKVTEHKVNLTAYINEQEKALHKKLEDNRRDVASGLKLMKSNIIEGKYTMEKIRNQIYAISKPIGKLPNVHLRNAKEMIDELKKNMPIGPYKLEPFMKYVFNQGAMESVDLGTLTKASDESENDTIQETIKRDVSCLPKFSRPAPSVTRKIYAGNNITTIDWMPNGDIIVVVDSTLKMFNVLGASKTLPFEVPDTTSVIHHVTVNHQSPSVAFVTKEVFHSCFLHIAKENKGCWSVNKHAIPKWCSSVVYTADGHLLVSGSENKMISFDSSGKKLWEREIKKRPIIMASRNNHNVIMSTADGELTVYNTEARHLSTFPFPTYKHCLKEPTGICVDSYDYVYIADSEKRSVTMFTPEGRYDREVVTVEGKPRHIALYRDRYICVAIHSTMYGDTLLTYQI